MLFWERRPSLIVTLSAPSKCCADTVIIPFPVNPAYEEILGEKCYGRISDIAGEVDTVTLYLGKARSQPLIDEIVSAKPRRIIMNPGAENFELARRGEAAGIEVVEGCTLVMLRSNRF